jgi:hypothetical protein
MLHYLIFFQSDNTYSVVRKSDIKKIEKDDEGEIAVVKRGSKSFVGRVIREGTAAFLNAYIVQNQLTQSATEEAEAEKENG